MSFTREDALKYHREMWSKIREEYGDNATNQERTKAKIKYLLSKGHACDNNCYLCEYSIEENSKEKVKDFCTLCPIDWTALADEDDPDRGTCVALYKNSYDCIYKCAPIDEILALPEREVEE